MRRLLIPLVALLLGAAAFTLASPGVDPCLAQGAGSADVEPRINCPGGTPPRTTACEPNTALRDIAVARRGRGLRFGFVRRGAGPVTVDVFQTSLGSRIVGNRRVARFTGRTRAFAWNGRRGSSGIYFVRFRARGAETRRFALRRRGGRFRLRPDFDRRSGCTTIRSFKLERPVFGGRTNRALRANYRLTEAGRVTITVRRGSRTVRRLRSSTDRANRTYRLRIGAEGLRRGDHRVRLTVRPTGGGPTVTADLTSARL